MYLTEYKNWLQANGQKPKTHGFNILKFFNYVKSANIDLTKLTYTDYSNFISELQVKKFSSNYINNVQKAVRSYYKFLILSGFAGQDCLDQINKFKLLKVERLIKATITSEELAQIVGSAMTFEYRVNPYKLRAVAYFMFYTGIRKTELLNLKRKDIDLDNCSAIIRVPVKNKSEGYIYFKPKITDMLKEYFDSEPEIDNAFNLTGDKLIGLVKKLNKYLPKQKNITPHSYRHSFGAMLAEKDTNVRIAQKLFRHKSLSSTMVYYDPDARVVEKVYKNNVDVISPVKPPKHQKEQQNDSTNGQTTSSTENNNTESQNEGGENI